jgi:hypothetical protein
MSKAKRSNPSICFKVTSEIRCKPLRRLELLIKRLQADGNGRYAKVAGWWPGKGGIEESPTTVLG